MTTAMESFVWGRTQIRTIDLNGRRWAVSADICAALDIKNSRDAVSRIDDADKLVIRRSDTVASTDSIWDAFAPQVQSIGLVSEDGATDLVLDSRKPEARRFRRFLTHVVWPSIRDTGSYGAAPALEGPELLARAVLEAQAMLAAKDERIAVLEPKAEFYDELMDAEGCYSMNAAAKTIGWGRNVMMRELRRSGVLQGNNLPYRRYEHHFKVIPRTYTVGDETRCTATTFVLPSGIPFLQRKLAGALEVAVPE